MKLSLNWIKDYVQIPDDMDLKKLAYDLTMSTVEVENTEELGKRFEGIVVGQIKEVLPHPNADKLRICKVDIGDGQIHDIVCGGSNLEVGMKVAVACPGAIVRWHGEGDPVEIKNAKLRGVESYGMICAAVELGLEDLLPDANDHAIMDLTAFDAKVGQPLAKALSLDDIILEIDNKSMTNRPDLWGHYGIAREISALYDLPLKKLEPLKLNNLPALKVDIQDKERCPRYIGVKMEGLGVIPSPFEMQSRIWRVGMRPINALVDITNYVMLAVGQPTHAFDANNILGGITVRHAKDNEKLLLLNDKTLTLCSDDLVIADDKEAVALAGVMGGAKDSILPNTKNVILEVANFESMSIRRTALRYDNRTEASTRYEKAIDIDRCDQALALCLELFKKIYPNIKLTAYTDQYLRHDKEVKVNVSLSWLESRLGKNLSKEYISHKLEKLGFKVDFAGDKMNLTVPSWRATGDIKIKEDIMEEVARMYGYENFEPTPITTTFTGAINQLDKNLVRSIKEYLAFRCNMQEIFSYPWMNDQYVNAVLKSTDGILKMSTPPAEDESYLRSSLLPNLCKAIAKNERYFNHFAIFEEAQIFKDEDYVSKYDEKELLPRQERHVAGCMVGALDSTSTLFSQVKGILENMPTYTHMERFTFKRDTKPVWANEVAWLNICVDNIKVGDLGLLDKKTSLDCGIKNLAAVLFEINTDALKPFKSRTNTFTKLAEFPINEYDVSLLFDTNVKWESILATALKKKNNESYLKDVLFVDEYTGKQVPEGKKSITIKLLIGADDKTLNSNEIEACANSVIKLLTKELNAIARSN